MSFYKAALYLKNGHLFEGLGFGKEIDSGGEVVFNTGMTGYQEIFSDPSYTNQIVTMTYPHIGNTGINDEDHESKNLFLKGIVVRELSQFHSNWRTKESLSEYLKKSNVPGISEIDTRQLTLILRNEGAQNGIIFSTEGVVDISKKGRNLIEKIPRMEDLDLVSQVSTKNVYEYSPGEVNSSGTIAVYDFGVKENILRYLKNRRMRVWVLPAQLPAEEILSLKPNAVLMSNGPGDPERVANVPNEIQKLLGKIPILAICMGHQLLARALEAKTYKLKFGHHGVNHPVQDVTTKKIYITSQNHGFSVHADELNREDFQVSHINLNDQTVEGFKSEKLKFLSVQFHPEAAPGPSDASSLFDQFFKGYLQ